MILAIEAGSRACSNEGVPPEAALGAERLQCGRAQVEVHTEPDAPLPLARICGGQRRGRDPVGGPARLRMECAGGVEESGEHAPSIGDGDGRARAVRLQNPRDPPAEAGARGDARRLAQDLRGRGIVAPLDQGGRLVDGGPRVAVLACEPGQATGDVEVAAAQGCVHQHARPVERELGTRKIVGGRPTLEHGRDREARARPRPDPARIAVSLEQGPRRSRV
jgi:hypothetical protein